MKKAAALFLAVALCLSLCTVTAFAAEPVQYLKADGTTGTCTDYTVMTDSTTTWAEGWYVVNDDVTINDSVSLTGDVNLIIEAEKTLYVWVEANVGSMIKLNGHTLTVYGQNNDYELSQWGSMNYKGYSSDEMTSSYFLICPTGITPIDSSTAGGKFVVNSGFVDIREFGDSTYLSMPLFGSNVEVTINNGAVNLTGASRSSLYSSEAPISIGGKAVTINDCAAVMAQGGLDSYNGQKQYANAFDPDVTTLTVNEKLLMATAEWPNGNFAMKRISDTAQVTLYFMNVTEMGACKIGETKYPSLAKAVSAVADGGTIALNMWNGETVTVSKAITFKVDAGEYTNGATVNAGTGYQVATSVSGTVTTYTVTATGGSGDNGGTHHYHGGTATVQSAKTADMGIALYGVLTVSSLLGMGWVSKKKH